MLPELFQIGSTIVPTYGFMIAIGFLSSLLAAGFVAKRLKIAPVKLVDLGQWSFVIGLIGTRFVYVLTRWDYFAANPQDIVKFWEGGLVFYGGPIFVFPFAIWYIKHHKLPIWGTLDCAVAGLAIAQAFGRLGCLGAGCCYGKPTDSAIGITFHEGVVPERFHGIALFPTQIMESVSMFLLFGFLIWSTNHRRFAGQLFFTYFIGYPIIRSVIEVFRGDKIRGFVVEDLISTSQFISLAVFSIASVVLYQRLREVRNTKLNTA